jgi:hypothetical protein
MTREGCCANWPKPCAYHEGWLDGYEAGYDDARREYQGGGWGPPTGGELGEAGCAPETSWEPLPSRS